MAGVFNVPLLLYTVTIFWVVSPPVTITSWVSSMLQAHLQVTKTFGAFVIL